MYALTPNDHTKILEALKKHNISATFISNIQL